MLRYAVLIGNTEEDVYSFNDPDMPDGKVELFCFGDFEEQKLLDFIQVFMEKKSKVITIMPHEMLGHRGEEDNGYL